MIALDAKSLQAIAEKLKERISEEAAEVWDGFRAKGAKHFQKQLIIVLVLFLVSYYLIYRPASERLAKVQFQVYSKNALVSVANEYEDIRSRLAPHYGRLPRMSEKNGWLFNQVFALAREDGIQLDSIGSQVEKKIDNFLLLSLNVSMELSYEKLGAFIARLEESKKLLRVAQLGVVPIEGKISFYKVELTIISMVPLVAEL